jgi:hypothetical protein
MPPKIARSHADQASVRRTAERLTRRRLAGDFLSRLSEAVFILAPSVNLHSCRINQAAFRKHQSDIRTIIFCMKPKILGNNHNRGLSNFTAYYYVVSEINKQKSPNPPLVSKKFKLDII